MLRFTRVREWLSDQKALFSYMDWSPRRPDLDLIEENTEDTMVQLSHHQCKIWEKNEYNTLEEIHAVTLHELIQTMFG